MAIRDGAVWQDTVTIDESPHIAMSSADLPGVAELPGGDLFAYWEYDDHESGNPEATIIQLGRSEDRGRSWTRLPPPHRDDVSGQHSFLAPFSSGGELGLVWLDAQKQRYVPSSGSGTADALIGAIGLRHASFGFDGRQVSDAFVDPVVCDCCPTAAVNTSRGPVVVYRDRQAPAGVSIDELRDDVGTVRDIALIRLEKGQWSEPRRVHADDWVIAACPVNGPAVDATRDQVVVAWWTAANVRPEAFVAFSPDAGGSFGAPISIGELMPDGQVTVASVDDGRAAVVGWVEKQQAWARWVGADGSVGPSIAIGGAPSRSRLPRWIATPDGVLAAWTDMTAQERSVRLAQLTW
jgi:hypothetical protein